MSAPMDDEDLLETDDYYAWLGIHKSASEQEINNAFRKMSRVYHPDKHAGNPEAVDNAEILFRKIQKAHEVLSDPHKKAIYDIMGVKGLETTGWEVVSRTKSAREILEEFESLQAQKEERQLEQCTNPKGTLIVSTNATDLFERYEDDESSFPQIEISQISISQSVDCPLTTKDSSVIGGSLNVSNGKGSGLLTTSYRRVLSHKSWAMAHLSAGSGAVIGCEGFRTLWNRAYGTIACKCALSRKGFAPVFSSMISQQLSTHVLGRMTLSAGPKQSAMQTVLVWDNERNNVMLTIQLGVPDIHFGVTYSYNLPDYDLKLRAKVKVGTISMGAEYGCQKKITKFSTLGATMIIGVPLGVMLKITLVRGNQKFLFPIHLSENIAPEPIIYGTVVPILVYAAIRGLIVVPFLNSEKERKLQKKKETNSARMQEKQREAEAAIDLMKETVDRSYEVEKNKGGLEIKKAVYGKLQGDNIDNEECINVTRPLQALVKNSKCVLPEGVQLSELPGFYDPSIGEEKQISINYIFRTQLHICTFKEGEKIVIPNRDHLCDTAQPDDR